VCCFVLFCLLLGTTPSYVPVVEIDRFIIGMLQLDVLLENSVAMMVRYFLFSFSCTTLLDTNLFSS
jgi:hypothetical protein